MAFDQKATFLIDGKTKWAGDFGDIAFEQPGFSGVDQSSHHGFIDGFEKTKMTDLRHPDLYLSVGGLLKVIDLCTDPADWPAAVIPGDE